MDDREALRTRVEDKRDLAIELQRELTAVPALAPQNGGTGEAEKAQVQIGRAHV
jgi:succinyl-diaminopimelate desuccinylase